MGSIKFTKMSGAGNDFVVVEKTVLGGAAPRAAARRLCARRGSIGADGLLILSRRPALRAEYYNADGSRAFCGNGSRCAAWWMHARGWAREAFEFETSGGRLRAEILGRERVRLGMPDARVLRRGLRLRAAGRALVVCAVDTGVPHAVAAAGPRGLDAFPVFEAGRALRGHPAFRPRGANADFVSGNSRACRLRTYERGVEAETGACGTGAVAAAVFAAEGGGRRAAPAGRRFSIPVRTRSGATLRASFVSAGLGVYRGVSLAGPAKITFQGEVSL